MPDFSWVRDPIQFRNRLKVEGTAGLKPLGQILEPWQREDFESMDAAWLAAAENRPHNGTKSFYFERARGHSKTTDIAVMVTWALVASRRPLSGIVAAADKKQAQILQRAIRRIVTNNPWLASFIDVLEWRVVNRHTKAELEILSGEPSVAYGRLCDFIVCDELTHWSKGDGHELWETLLSTQPKRQWCILVVISNAGVGRGKSWQWDVRSQAAASPEDWCFHRLDGPVASWITKSDLRKQRAGLLPSAFRRLWLNEWQTDDGEGIPAEDIEACMTLDGPGNPEPNRLYLAGLDLGIKRDHSGFSIVSAIPGTGRVRLERSYSWAPRPPLDRVSVAEIEATILRAHEQFNLFWVGYDPTEARYLAERLERKYVPMVEIPAVAKNLNLMATEFFNAFANHALDLYPDPQFRRDLNKVLIAPRPYGHKIESERDEHGHADRAMAFAIVLPAAMEVATSDVNLDDTPFLHKVVT